MKNKLLSMYGENTFNDEEMKRRFPKEIYLEFIKCKDNYLELSNNAIEIIANTIKIWAIEKDATHYCHLFFPLNGRSSGKQNSFIELRDKNPIYQFEYNELIKSELDASSFPSGGLRNLIAAKGYAKWDISSYCFIKDNVLYIPSLFYSLKNDALDEKISLIRSNKLLSKEGVKLLRKLNYKDVKNIKSMVGCEQEYFLIDEKFYNNRIDLLLMGRTLFGKKVTKNQDAYNHYLGNIEKRIQSFMIDLDNVLHKFSIPSKIRHNEAAPSQFEVVCIYQEVCQSCNDNQLLMKLIKECAKKHHLVCLLNEKPFKGINGSGKHNNWSLLTDTGINLFNNSNENRLVFLALLACLIKGLDEYSSLLTLTITYRSNELRLGDLEAPPNIISLYLGREVDEIIDSVLGDENKIFKYEDLDRNRTSPFSYVNNRFEFRGLGSSKSIAFVNTILNFILADQFKEMNKLLEDNEPMEIIKKFILEHKRIIYNGDGYSSTWKNLAVKRGINISTNFIDVINVLKDKQIIKRLVDSGIYTKQEINSKFEVLLNQYKSEVEVEIATSLKMINNYFYPSFIKYLSKLEENRNLIQNPILKNKLTSKIDTLSNKLINIDNIMESINLLTNEKIDKLEEIILSYIENILPKLEILRKEIDEIEGFIDLEYYPFPTYDEILFKH